MQEWIITEANIKGIPIYWFEKYTTLGNIEFKAYNINTKEWISKIYSVSDLFMDEVIGYVNGAYYIINILDYKLSKLLGLVDKRKYQDTNRSIFENKVDLHQNGVFFLGNKDPDVHHIMAYIRKYYKNPKYVIMEKEHITVILKVSGGVLHLRYFIKDTIQLGKLILMW